MSKTPKDILLHLRTLHPKLIDMGLSRVEAFLNVLGNPQNRLPPAIHIAGTNGKGSITATLRALYQAHGKTCHVMTSPHLVRFNERIVLAGKDISDDFLVEVLEDCEKANASNPITFFEITTCAGFHAFAKIPADIALIEVGMGGRLDATNVIKKPAATVISVISHDHEQWLGNTLAQIAAEKAGIMKPETPCIIAPQTNAGEAAGLMQLFADKAAELNAPIYRYGHEWGMDILKDRFVLHYAGHSLDMPHPNLHGAHQINNAATALLTALIAQENTKITIEESKAEKALQNIHWPARLQTLKNGVIKTLLPQHEVILDGGHNDSAGQVLAQQAKHWQLVDNRPLHMIMGMLETKNAVDFVAPLKPYIKSLSLVPVPEETLSFNPEKLADILGQNYPHLNITTANNVTDAAMQLAPQMAVPSRVLIAGSLYLAGAVLKENE